MATLRGAASVGTALLLVGLAVDAGLLVVGVAGAGGGEFGLEGFIDRPPFRSHPARQLAHPVGLLLSQGDTAAAGAFGVGGFGTVLIDLRRQPLGRLLQVLGLQARPHRGQLAVRGGAGADIHPRGQLVVKGRDHRHMLGIQGATGLGGGGGLPHRRQRLPAHRLPRTQRSGVGQPAFGLTIRDPQRSGEHRLPRRLTQPARLGLGGQPRQHPMFQGGDAAQHGRHLCQQLHQLAVGQGVAGVVQHRDLRPDRLHRARDFPHISNTSSNHRHVRRDL
ncbi:hypothetical protein MCHLDSM_06096 [Mycolicibacterium chlorophenolicum]|uniref:Uncharacterized protein n=1 Tax=Mycolicibacterium chlorophenolicum TaxID=37916 RepID=A0A0J6VCA8_9MYCO|nr:hypothetical protein MCHLDSM_06096 [Mycolicibacterium chlorophenolicum]